MYGWALNAKAPARSCRGRRRFASSALSDPPGSSARGPIGGSRFAVATPCGGLLGRSRATPSQQLPDTLRGEGLTVGRVMTRGVQLVRHPARSPTCGVPALHVLPHRRRVGDLLPRPHPAADLMLRHRPAGPMQLHPHFLARRRGPNHHPLQQQPHHLAPSPPPMSWAPATAPAGRGPRPRSGLAPPSSTARAALLEPMVVLLQAPLPQQSLFPVSFQRPRRQAVLRLDGVVLPEYTVGVLSRPLQP